MQPLASPETDRLTVLYAAPDGSHCIPARRRDVTVSPDGLSMTVRRDGGTITLERPHRNADWARRGPDCTEGRIRGGAAPR